MSTRNTKKEGEGQRGEGQRREGGEGEEGVERMNFELKIIDIIYHNSYDW